jgi:hypothetical protein
MQFWYKIQENIADFRYNIPKIYSPLDAAKLTVESIMESYTPPYFIFTSGGVDSQAMIYSWQQFGKNFIPVCYVYNNYLNIHDIVTLSYFSSLHNLNIEYRYLDVIEFIKDEFSNYATKYQCSSPWINTYIRMAEGFQGTVIFSGNYLSSKGAVLTNAMLGLYRASQKNKNIIPYFFLHTPELAYSFLLNANIPSTNYDEKVQEYIDNGFPVIRQKDKLTGFENIKDIYDEILRPKLNPLDVLKYKRKPSIRPMDIILRYPFEKKFKDEELQILVNDFKKWNH